MIVVRDVFRLKFGQSKDATALWKQAVGVLKNAGFTDAKSIRILTDLVGSPYYTIVLESTFESAAAWEKSSMAVRANPEWKAIYAKIAALTETGHREMLSVID